MTEIFTHTDQSALIQQCLTSFLPYSLPLLRRVQFMSFPGDTGTPDSTLLSSVPLQLLQSSPTDLPRCFVFAFLDFSRGPETEMWIFSSLELYQGKDSPKPGLSSEEEALCREQVLAVFRKIGQIEKSYVESEFGKRRGRQRLGVVNCGSLHECLVGLVEEKGILVDKSVETLKFIGNISDLMPIPNLPINFKWSVVHDQDIEYVLTKTVIPRKRRTVKLFPSAAVIDEKTGSLAAWAFSGVDGSLTHLYVEEAYRGLGLAKAVSLKLYHENIPRYGDDGYTHCDVEIQNLSSQGVARSLGGVHKWTIHWTWIRFSNA